MTEWKSHHCLQHWKLQLQDMSSNVVSTMQAVVMPSVKINMKRDTFSGTHTLECLKYAKQYFLVQARYNTTKKPPYTAIVN